MIDLKKIGHYAIGRCKGSPATVLFAVLIVVVTVLSILAIGAPMILDDLDEMQHVRSSIP